jgi:hypothetical protein
MINHAEMVETSIIETKKLQTFKNLALGPIKDQKLRISHHCVHIQKLVKPAAEPICICVLVVSINPKNAQNS